MELSAVLEVLKHLPEGVSSLIIFAVVIFTMFHKRQDAETTKIISISEMQNKQLTQLLNQNEQLGNELHATRKELREAYEIIADMRKRIQHREEMINKQGE